MKYGLKTIGMVKIGTDDVDRHIWDRVARTIDFHFAEIPTQIIIYDRTPLQTLFEQAYNSSF
jgi:hypothetical protein